jgi:hypothetical protein
MTPQDRQKAADDYSGARLKLRAHFRKAVSASICFCWWLAIA